MDNVFFRRVNALLWLLLIDFFVLQGVVQAGDHAPVGARAAAMGHASVTLPDSYSLWNNPSGLAYSPHAAVLWSVHVPFGISDLSLKSLGLILPVGQMVLASNLSYFGYSSYHEWEVNLVLARKLAPDWSLGVQMGFFKKFIAQTYKSPSLLVGSLGVMGKVNEQLRVGMFAYNFTRATKQVSAEQRIPSILRFGLSYQVVSGFLLTTEVSKDVEMLSQWKFGAEYSVVEQLFLRGGFSLGSVRQFSFGLGFSWKHCIIDIAFGYHLVLGCTPHVSMVWNNPWNR